MVEDNNEIIKQAILMQGAINIVYMQDRPQEHQKNGFVSILIEQEIKGAQRHV